MMPSQTIAQLKETIRWQRLTVLCCAIGLLCGTGCRQRALTELYVENMASEIRMLEDRIYEYDAAYMEKDSEYESLRHEVEIKKKEIADLQRELGLIHPHSNSSPKSPSLKLKDKQQPREATESNSKNSYELPSVLDFNSTMTEAIVDPPVVSRTPVAPPSSANKSKEKDEDSGDNDFLPPGSASELIPPAIPIKPKGATDAPQASNANRFPKRKSNPPSPDNLVEQFDLPESMIRSAQQPKLIVVPAPLSNQNPGSLPSNFPSQPSHTPNLLPKAFPKIQDGNPQSAIQRGMIHLPEGSRVQFASAVEPTAPNKPKKITDTEIVEIGFHPAMCRGHNFDDKPGDDGLYLVVTPINAAGQTLNQFGTLTVIVEDPSEPTEFGRIAAWEFTPEQLADTLEPIGASQGFHLSLPWKDKTPTSKTVTVYLRYSCSNGRTLVNQRAIQLRVPSAEKAVWTPRKTTAK